MLLWSVYSVVTLKLWFEKSQSLTTNFIQGDLILKYAAKYFYGLTVVISMC